MEIIYCRFAIAFDITNAYYTKLKKLNYYSYISAEVDVAMQENMAEEAELNVGDHEWQYYNAHSHSIFVCITTRSKIL